MEGEARPPFSRQGGKYLLYKTVIANFPKDYQEMTYVEPFVGGGSVFFNTEPLKKSVVNDFDEVVVETYKALKNNPKELENRVNGTYNEKDFYEIKAMKPTSAMGRVVQSLLLQKLSYMGFRSTFDTTKGSKKVIDKDFQFYSDKLKNTTILNEDYKKVIQQYDSPNTLFYCDPPYEESNRTVREYKDISMDDFADLLSKIKGKFLVSINNSPRIRKLFSRYNIKKVKTYYSISKTHVTELLISNY